MSESEIPLPIIGDGNQDVEVWGTLMKNWLDIKKIGDTDQFKYILASTRNEATKALSDAFGKKKENLTLEECKEALKIKYRRKNNKEGKFRKLKSLTISYNESIEEFNDTFLELYDELDQEEKDKISVLDYENAIKKRKEIYEKVAFAEAETLEKACKIAEKAARILEETKPTSKFNGNNKGKSTVRNNNFRSNNFQRHGGNFSSFPKESNYNYNNHNNYNSFNKSNVKENKNGNYSRAQELQDVDEITRGIQNMQIKTCYFCGKPGHFIRFCPHYNQGETTKN